MNTWSCVLSWGVPWVAQLLFVLLFLHCTLLNRIDFHTIFHFTIVPSVRPALSNAINFTPNWTSALSFFVCYRMPNQRSLWNESQAKKKQNNWKLGQRWGCTYNNVVGVDVDGHLSTRSRVEFDLSIYVTCCWWTSHRIAQWPVAPTIWPIYRFAAITCFNSVWAPQPWW